VTSDGSSTKLHTMQSVSSGLVAKLWSMIKEFGPRVAPTGIWLGAALVLSIALAVAHSPLTPLPGVVTILVIPGAMLMSMLRTRPAKVAGRVVLAVVFSMMIVMVVGGLASLLGPCVGIAQPLDTVTQRFG
jgi:hypothetical protein